MRFWWVSHFWSMLAILLVFIVIFDTNQKQGCWCYHSCIRRFWNSSMFQTLKIILHWTWWSVKSHNRYIRGWQPWQMSSCIFHNVDCLFINSNSVKSVLLKLCPENSIGDEIIYQPMRNARANGRVGVYVGKRHRWNIHPWHSAEWNQNTCTVVITVIAKVSAAGRRKKYRAICKGN